MSSKKNIGVLLTDDAWGQLGEAIEPYSNEGSIGRYLYCKSILPDGPYFMMVVERDDGNGGRFEAEFFIPHRFVKAYISTPNSELMGFV